MTIIERLNNKKVELKERLIRQNQWGSQRKEALQYKIKTIEKLINFYQSEISSVNLLEAREIFDQWVGFEKQKSRILDNLELKEFQNQHNILSKPQVLCFVGPAGVGKTTFAQLFAQVWKKQIFSVALGGLADASILIGNSESSSGTDIGQLARALVVTKTPNPVILLEEIDKTSSAFKNTILDCLVAVLDPVQNQEILDYYLDVKLDYSQVTFIVTANNLNKIPSYLRSRMLIIELPGYTIEQKKEIADQIIKEWFMQNKIFDQNKFEITPEALTILISRTKEKGVRQLKLALDFIFNYCSLQWYREEKRGEAQSKIIANCDLVNQKIPQDFLNIDQDEQQDEEKLNFKIQKLEKEVRNLRERKESNWITNNNFCSFFCLVGLVIVGIYYSIFKVRGKTSEIEEQNLAV